jgi:hypothetical protein
MPIYIAKQDIDFEVLASSIARTPRAAAAVLSSVRARNPHLADVTLIPKGTLLLLPEGPNIKPDAGTSAGGQDLGEFARRFRDGLRGAASRATERGEALLADHAGARDALKSAAAKRLIEGDVQLRKRLEAAEASFKAEQKQAAKSRAQILEAATAAQAELARVESLIR